MPDEPNWKEIAEDLASSLGDFNHDWAEETRGSMYRDCHTAMVAYYEAKDFDWRMWVLEQGKAVCTCHDSKEVANA